MFVLAALVFVAVPTTGIDPVDDDALPASPDVHVHVALKSVNGVPASRASIGDLWPLDDVVVTADGSTVSAGVASYAWMLVKKPDDSDVALIADGADARFVFDLKGRKVGGLDEPGTYVVRAIVTSTKGDSSHRDLIVRVQWPGRSDAGADRDGTPRTSSSSSSSSWKAAKVPAPDKTAKARARHVDETLGSTVACCGTLAGGVACACATAGLGGGIIGPAVLAATGPAAAVASVFGASAGALSDGGKLEDMSPWLFVGTGIELTGVLVLAADYGASQLINATGHPIDSGYYVGAAVVGVGLMIIGLPVPMAVAWTTSRPESG